eukprot:3932020-Rhodomonas_salina.4
MFESVMAHAPRNQIQDDTVVREREGQGEDGEETAGAPPPKSMTRKKHDSGSAHAAMRSVCTPRPSTSNTSPKPQTLSNQGDKSPGVARVGERKRRALELLALAHDIRHFLTSHSTMSASSVIALNQHHHLAHTQKRKEKNPHSISTRMTKQTVVSVVLRTWIRFSIFCHSCSFCSCRGAVRRRAAMFDIDSSTVVGIVRDSGTSTRYVSTGVSVADA